MIKRRRCFPWGRAAGAFPAKSRAGVDSGCGRAAGTPRTQRGVGVPWRPCRCATAVLDYHGESPTAHCYGGGSCRFPE
eukprot:15457977-Alexandrium_andersonii.AAC.1